MRPTTKRNEEPIYQKLAALLERMIQDRSLRPGDRMPSIRRFSVQQGVSIPTTLQAYATLEARGMIVARPRSGFYVRTQPIGLTKVADKRAALNRARIISSLEPAQSVLVGQHCMTHAPLGAAVPSPELLPTKKLIRTMAAIGRRFGPASISYDETDGSTALRQTLAQRSLDWGCSLTAEDFIVTIGATEALMLALRTTCKPGDTVVIESPTYWGLTRMLNELKLKPWPIPSSGASGMDLDALETGLRRKRPSACVSIPNFHNPVGFVVPDEKKKRLVEMLSARGIPLIEDDIYGDLQHHGPRPRCLKAFDKADSVILCGSFSKTLAPGFRVGYIAPGKWHSKISALKTTSTLSCAPLIELTVAEFLKNGGYDRYLRSVRQAFREQVHKMSEAILENFPEGTLLSQPKGGFLLWCELPANIDAIKLFKLARRSEISIAPGSLFCPNGGFRNFIRINCGSRWTRQIEHSIETLGQLARSICS